ncbi:MAG: ferric reductase-like transmembrane domain-containing protein [Verrucomicrobia bacterium]|nr:ferric reductase-like transmembrane domain-containing protein [Verrucomicrobiota bacterium]
MNGKILALLKNKKTIWLICSIPLLILLSQAFFLSFSDYKFWGRSLLISAYSAVSLLVLTLAFAPLSKHFPSVPLLLILNRHKRETGLCCFFYADIHVSSYYIRKVLKMGSFNWDVLLHPMILAGETALLILILLALTSNDFSIRKMQYSNWKSLHRFIYLAEAAVFTHMALKGGIVLFWGLALFIPLAALQLYRRKKPKPSTSEPP